MIIKKLIATILAFTLVLPVFAPLTALGACITTGGRTYCDDNGVQPTYSGQCIYQNGGQYCFPGGAFEGDDGPWDAGDTGGGDNGGFGPAVEGTNPPGFGQSQQLTEAGETVGCSSNGNFGGALANALGAGLQQAIPGLLRGQLGGLVNKLSAQAGPFGPLVNALGKIGIDKLSNIAQQKIGELFGGAGSSLTGIFSGSGSALIGSIGSLGGGAAAAAGVGTGVSVPVSEIGQQLHLTTKIQADTVFIRKDQLRDADANETLAYKECVSDPLVAKIKNALLAMLTRSIIDWVNNGFEGGPAFVQNLRDFLREGSQALITDFVSNQLSGICSPYRQDVQAIILTQYQYEEDFGSKVQCTDEQAATSASQPNTFDVQHAFERIFEPSKSPIGTTIAAESSYLEQNADRAFTTIIDNLNSEGFQSKQKCTDNSQAPQGGYCEGGKIVVPGSLIKDQVATKLGLADQQLLNSDEIGEVIDALTQSLTQVAFEGIDGLLGLSKKKTGGGGSYLDNLVGQSTGDSVGAAQDAVSGDVLGVISVEEAYNAILAGVIKDLGDIKKAYVDMGACYQPKAASNPALLAQVQHASTTVATIINPQLANFNQQLNESDDALDLLEVLYTQSQSALTPADVVQVNTALNQLISSGKVHTGTDLNFLENSLTSGALALQTLYLDAAEKLAQCKAL